MKVFYSDSGRWVTHLVVDVAVCEHGVEVLYTLLGVPVVIVLQASLYGAHVHRYLDDLIVVLKSVHKQKEVPFIISLFQTH